MYDRGLHFSDSLAINAHARITLRVCTLVLNFTSNLVFPCFKKDLIIKMKIFVWWEDPTPGRGDCSNISMENGEICCIIITKALLM